MTWTIDKQFNFCYGHRVWSQKLNEAFCQSGDTETKCKHLHGHEATVHVFLESTKLNEQAMVTDFKHLGWVKDFIDTYVDHKFIVDRNDPAFDKIVGGSIDHDDLFFGEELLLADAPLTSLRLQPIEVPGVPEMIVGYTIDCNDFEHNDPEDRITPTQREVLSGFTIVDFVPTSENLARWLHGFISPKMDQLGVKTARIEWFETPKSRSTFTP